METGKVYAGPRSSSFLLGCGAPTGEMSRPIFEDRVGPDLGGPWASG